MTINPPMRSEFEKILTKCIQYVREPSGVCSHFKNSGEER